MNKYMSCVLISLIILSGCTKENSSNWVISNSLFTEGCLDRICECEYSDEHIYQLENSCSGIFFEESHELDPIIGNYHLKGIMLEIPNPFAIDSFKYTNEDIYNNLDCEVYESSSNKYYRVKRGFISGEKMDGEWQVDFDISFGGKDNDKFRLIKDAEY
ncbi:MAG: hypothetical protein H7X71_04695 [Chitinophagales bacterium]|nr:hypothetical protein [Chitinophagales bacterium]